MRCLVCGQQRAYTRCNHHYQSFALICSACLHARLGPYLHSAMYVGGAAEGASGSTAGGDGSKGGRAGRASSLLCWWTRCHALTFPALTSRLLSEWSHFDAGWFGMAPNMHWTIPQRRGSVRNTRPCHSVSPAQRLRLLQGVARPWPALLQRARICCHHRAPSNVDNPFGNTGIAPVAGNKPSTVHTLPLLPSRRARTGVGSAAF